MYAQNSIIKTHQNQGNHAPVPLRIEAVYAHDGARNFALTQNHAKPQLESQAPAQSQNQAQAHAQSEAHAQAWSRDEVLAQDSQIEMEVLDRAQSMVFPQNHIESQAHSQWEGQAQAQIQKQDHDIAQAKTQAQAHDLVQATEKIHSQTNGPAKARHHTIQPRADEDKVCLVCGDDGAKMHYGALSCLGCKGFFRRALKKANEYECMKKNDCLINKHERNSCRACRLQKCLAAGMDPSAVRPDRDFTGKQRQNHRFTAALRCFSSSKTPQAPNRQVAKSDVAVGTASTSASATSQKEISRAVARRERETRDESTDWVKRLPVEMRTMLMNLLNIEAKVVRGDTMKDASDIYPLGINTIREIIDEPLKLCGRRTAMRYEPYRMARNEELSVIVYRRLIAAIDWVALLAEMMDGELSTDDRIALVKSAFGPLTLFKCSAKTATVTDEDNLLCLCNFAYVPRNIAKAYSDTYHLDNGLVDRLLNELVLPFRRIHLQEEEIVCLSAIIVLNPMAKDLSETAISKVNRLRDRINDTLYQIVKESRKNDTAPAPHFGNLLLYLPIVTGCANAMTENLRFAQTFSAQGAIPLLTSFFGCFPVEPFLESEFTLAASITDAEHNHHADNCNSNENICGSGEKTPATGKNNVLCKNAQVQTDDGDFVETSNTKHGTKRQLPAYFTSPVKDDSAHDFRLLHAPCSYTLTEMFDDCAYGSNSADSPTPGHSQIRGESHSQIQNRVDSHSRNFLTPLAPTASLPTLTALGAAPAAADSNVKAPRRSAVARLSSWSDTATQNTCGNICQQPLNRRQTLHSTYYSGLKHSQMAVKTAETAAPLRAVSSTPLLEQQTNLAAPSILLRPAKIKRTSEEQLKITEQSISTVEFSTVNSTSSQQPNNSCATASTQWYPNCLTVYSDTAATTTAAYTVATTVEHSFLQSSENQFSTSNLTNFSQNQLNYLQYYEPYAQNLIYTQLATIPTTVVNQQYSCPNFQYQNCNYQPNFQSQLSRNIPSEQSQLQYLPAPQLATFPQQIYSAQAQPQIQPQQQQQQNYGSSTISYYPRPP